MRSPLITKDRIITLAARAKVPALTELVDVLARLPEVEDRDELLQAIVQRERDLSTAMGFGFAVPHAKIFSVREFVMAVGLSREGIEFDAIDGQPVHLVVMIAGPVDRQRRYLQLLRQVTLILRDQEQRNKVITSCDVETAFEVFGGIQ
jgi:mannitol/fructose-specific phosphotransferase system IIA component (Ntr-type)